MKPFTFFLRMLCWGCSLLGAAMLSGPTNLPGQTAGTGTLAGRVLHAASGTYLGNVRVVIEGTTHEALTDQNGEYRFPSLPAGPVRLMVSHTGLLAQTRSLQIVAGQVVSQDFELGMAGTASPQPGVVTLDAFTVEERELTAQGAALHEQRTAANIKNVVSMDEFGDLGITNPGHFLTYVPGISNIYNTTGEVEGIGIRGMDASGTVVMFDGLSAATNDPTSRAFNFSGSSTANIEYIEVNKVPTPDLPANAVGGSINMVTKSGLNRKTPLLTYNVFTTFQAKGSPGNLNVSRHKHAGPDKRTTMHPVQPGISLSYVLPVSPSLAFTFDAGHNARVQDREYIGATWDRVRHVQTAGSLNSVLNIFQKQNAGFGVDWKLGAHQFQVRAAVSAQNAYTRQNVYNYNFGAGATGSATSTQGAATAVGSVNYNLGQSINQYRRLRSLQLRHSWRGEKWSVNWKAGYSENRRTFSDIDEDFFGTVNVTRTGLVLSGEGIDRMEEMEIPRLSARTAAGATVDPYDVSGFTLNTAASGRMFFENVLKSLAADVTRSFDTTWPLSIKAGVLIEENSRENWTRSLSWTVNPPASAGGRVVGNYDLVAEGYSERRHFNGGLNLDWLSGAKLYEIYLAHPEYFVLNETAAHTVWVNNRKSLEETISAGYIRADLKALSNRLRLAFGARMEHTKDEGYGPLDDITATYQRDPAGNILYGSNGRPMTIAADALTLIKLRYRELGSYNEKSYHDLYPSLNASYAITDTLIARTGYASTIGRPNIAFVTPGMTISDPSIASPIITVINTGLQPWTADNFDLTLESYELKGAQISVAGFYRKISNFFVSQQIPLTQELVDQHGIPPEVIDSDYEVRYSINSPDYATQRGLELSWRQSLRSFAGLPSWMQSFGFFANSTFLRIGGPGANNFTGYSTRVYNGGINYLRRNFALKINVTSSNGPRQAVVAANATTPAGTYSALADRTLVSGSIEYRINKTFTIHLSGQNLSNALFRNMTFSPGAPAYTRPAQYRDNGVDYVIGVKGQF